MKVWPKEIPFEGISANNYDAISAYSQWLEKTSTPKLLLYAKPGMIVKKKEVERIQRDYKELEAVYVGKGKHYIQEDQPHEIGKALNSWAQRLKDNTTI